MNLSTAVSHLVAPLRRRVLLLVGRAVVRLSDDAKGLQELQLSLLRGETRAGVERLQEYGLSSRPLKGAHAVTLFLGGNRDHGLVVAVDDRRHRPRGLAEGEVCLYDDLGKRVLLRRDGTLLIEGATEVTLDVPTVTIAGDLHVAGEVVAQHGDDAVELGALRDTFNLHTHPGDSGGTTGPPAPQA